MTNLATNLHREAFFDAWDASHVSAPAETIATGPTGASSNPLRPFRTLFLSDIHLGTRACQAENLLSFMRLHQADTIYLVGDIIDFWALSRGIYWPAAHNTFVQKILKEARHDVRVVFIPGNHDEALREYAGSHFGNVRVEREFIHQTADGKKLLLVHGDEFDQIARCHRWIAVLGDISYNVLVRINVWLSWVRRKLRKPGYWSLAGYAKQRIKGALEFIYGFEAAVARYAHHQGVDGVVCGHIHSAVIKEVEGITYINCGDWVDSCTAIVEHHDGRLELVHWSELTKPLAVEPANLATSVEPSQTNPVSVP